jgi:serpin B
VELFASDRRLVCTGFFTGEESMNFNRVTTNRRTLLKMAFLGLATGCYPCYGKSFSPALPSFDEDLLAAARSSNRFALDLQKQLGAKAGNLFFSPASISAALAMTAAGAEGETAKEMLTVLHSADDRKAWLSEMGGLSKSLNASGEGFVLEMANRLWGQTGFQFRADYLEFVEQKFAAPLGQLDFVGASEPSRKTINDWISDKTHDRINDLLPQGSIDGNTRLVLTNAIYFKADWKYQFDKKFTVDQPFTTGSGKQTKLPLMNLEKEFAYVEDEQAQVLELPYKSPQLSMVVVLPRKADGLSKLEQGLNFERLEQWLAGLRREKVIVALPKFKLECDFSLSAALKQLGMPRAFGGGAEFGGMTSEADLQISDVVHKAFVEVDEKGTEAAAATGVIMATRAAPIENPPKVFRADHPFLFLIRNRESNAVLFLGRFSEPK